ncbi:hypothetical protein GCM10009839_09150 [Catenulispora yoronensis]|uniref:Uncharacterized protein n=1 Tax=Catenulispora yoronensis TaxID=450799 RepID=A0ABP5F6E2_9ACTN
MTAQSRWHLQDAPGHFYSGEQARLLLGNRRDHGSPETWFEDERGRLLAVTTDGARASVRLMAGPGDAGERLTATFEVAGRAVAHLIDHGVWPAEVSVEDDR